MNKILLEVIPREVNTLLNEVSYVKNSYSQISGINIPDLLRFETRSWEAAVAVKSVFSNVIPHIRAIDFDINNCDPRNGSLYWNQPRNNGEVSKLLGVKKSSLFSEGLQTNDGLEYIFC